jgi:hypothetical protein
LSRDGIRRSIEHVFDTGLAYEEDVFGTPVPFGVVSAARRVERFVDRASVPAPPVLSGPVAALLDAVEAVLVQVPAELPGPQALADTAALLKAVERLRGAVLPRLADVETRRLHTLDGAGSAASWVAQQQTSLDRGEVALARRLSTLPQLADAVQSGLLSVEGAQRVGTALARIRRHVDRPDGLIDGLDGEAVVRAAVVDGVADIVLTALGGLEDADPRLPELHASLTGIADAPLAQYARLEAGFVLLATRLEPQLLPSALKRLTDALLPSQLERRAHDAHAERGFTIRLNSDGSGWHVSEGELDLETGELLSVVLQAEAAVDPDNPADTAAFVQARDGGWTGADGVDVLDRPHDPRSLRQRRHDALRNALRRYLDSGIAGSRDRFAPHLAVTVSTDTLDGRPGALPAVTGSGASVPGSLLHRWAATAPSPASSSASAAECSRPATPNAPSKRTNAAPSTSRPADGVRSPAAAADRQLRSPRSSRTTPTPGPDPAPPASPTPS